MSLHAEIQTLTDEQIAGRIPADSIVKIYLKRNLKP